MSCYIVSYVCVHVCSSSSAEEGSVEEGPVKEPFRLTFLFFNTLFIIYSNSMVFFLKHIIL